MPRPLRPVTILALCALFAAPPAAGAQSPLRPAEVFPAREGEDQLRLLQGRGEVPAYPWSIRGFGPREVVELLPADSSLPAWASPGFREAAGKAAYGWIDPELRLIYNSAFPFGTEPGAVWAGRGVTAALQAGFSARWGPVSLVVAPVAFYAQNTDFELGTHGGASPFADHRAPRNIDLPQRFGDGSYARVDPGHSTLRVEGLGVTAGVSTAPQQWGPMREHALLVGAHAPGFPHVFLGTARPVDLWLVKAHARVVYGATDQSDFSPMPADSADRFLSGIVGVVTPRGVDGLEVGIGRIIHTALDLSDVGADEIFQVFQGGFADTPGENLRNENQLVSVFFRWVLPGSGFEVYGEHVREDFSFSPRDLALNPDVNAGNALGFMKSWSRPNGGLLVLRGEWVHARTAPGSPLGFKAVYRHGRVRQGHTHRGQLLGSPFAFFGSGSVLALDLYGPEGRWSLTWTRHLREEPGGAAEDPRASDVIHALGVERRLFLRGFALTAEVTAAYDFNRYLEDDDRFNLNTRLQIRPVF